MQRNIIQERDKITADWKNHSKKSIIKEKKSRSREKNVWTTEKIIAERKSGSRNEAEPSKDRERSERPQYEIHDKKNTADWKNHSREKKRQPQRGGAEQG